MLGLQTHLSTNLLCQSNSDSTYFVLSGDTGFLAASGAAFDVSIQLKARCSSVPSSEIWTPPHFQPFSPRSSKCFSRHQSNPTGSIWRLSHRKLHGTSVEAIMEKLPCYTPWCERLSPFIAKPASRKRPKYPHGARSMTCTVRSR